MRKYGIALRNLLYFLTIGLYRSIAQLRQEQNFAKLQNKKLHVIIMIGGLGDIIASEPTIRFIVQPDEHIVILARPTYLSAFEFNPSIDIAIRVDSYVQALILKRIFVSTHFTNLHVDGHRCNMFRIPISNPKSNGITTKNYYENRTLCDVYASVATGNKLPDRPRIYADPDFNVDAYLKEIFTQDKMTILFIHPKATSTIRSLPAELCYAIVDAVLEQTDVKIIELGLDPILVKREGTRVHLPREKLSIGQQKSLLVRGKAFIGVDSGFSHVANAVGMRSLLLLGAFENFPNYFPWKPGKHDIVIRSSGSLNDIPVDNLIAATLTMLSEIS